jgi:precorrin-6Y C5,15-methyltransferase (decarboxylating)
MNKINVIGIGFRPLDKKASEILLASDVVLTNKGLLEAFKSYAEYDKVKDNIIVHGSVYEMLDYIAENYQDKKISLLGIGDPMFFGIGRLLLERFGKEPVEIYPDLSSVQVAFSRVKETSNNAFLVSMHGGPDPKNRRKLEHEMTEVPDLLAKHGKLAILTDRENTPSKIAEVFLKPSADSCQLSALKVYVCERLGQEDERIIEGTPEEIAGQSFAHPNVVILKSVKADKN